MALAASACCFALTASFTLFIALSRPEPASLIFFKSEPLPASTAALIASVSCARATLSLVLPSESLSSLRAAPSLSESALRASFKVFSSLDLLTFSEAVFTLCSCVVYHFACVFSLSAVAFRPSVSVAVQESVFGAVAFSSLLRAATTFASATCSAVTLFASLAFATAFAYTLFALVTLASAFEHASFAASSFALSPRLHTTTPTVTLTTSTTAMMAATIRAALFFFPSEGLGTGAGSWVALPSMLLFTVVIFSYPCLPLRRPSSHTALTHTG